MNTFQRILLYQLGYYPEHRGARDCSNVSPLSIFTNLFSPPNPDNIDSIHLYEYLKMAIPSSSFIMHSCFSFLIHYAREGTYNDRLAFFKNVWTNPFISPAEKEEFLQVFQKAQRTYRAFSRFAFRYRVYKAPVRVEADIFLTPISENQANVIAIYHVGAKYLFTLSDLMSIANAALDNSFYMHADPNPIKNPYNNLPFSKSNLYYLYFFMQWRHYMIPQLFRLFFRANFNLLVFRLENECLLQDRCIKKKIDGFSQQAAAREIRQMLKQNRYGRKLRIHLTFPNEDLIRTMKPWLHLYYYSVFSMSQGRKQLAKMKLDCLIKNLVTQNPNYGRRYTHESPFTDSATVVHEKKYEEHKFKMKDDFMNDHTNTNTEIQEFGLAEYFSDSEYSTSER